MIQPTTCSYCAEQGHTERECERKKNMLILSNKTKLHQHRFQYYGEDFSYESTSDEDITIKKPTKEQRAQSFDFEPIKAPKDAKEKETKKPEEKDFRVNKNTVKDRVMTKQFPKASDRLVTKL